MTTVATDLLIKASRPSVWAVLSDFKSYPAWNPFMCRIEGKGVVGNRLTVELNPDDRKMTFRPIVTRWAPDGGFSWRGSLPIPGLFVGEHSFALEDEAQGTRVTQMEVFSGLLVPLMKTMLQTTEAAFVRMNQALMQEVLRRNGQAVSR